jgi:hypothetical protein
MFAPEGVVWHETHVVEMSTFSVHSIEEIQETKQKK